MMVDKKLSLEEARQCLGGLRLTLEEYPYWYKFVKGSDWDVTFLDNIKSTGHPKLTGNIKKNFNDSYPYRHSKYPYFENNEEIIFMTQLMIDNQIFGPQDKISGQINLPEHPENFYGNFDWGYFLGHKNICEPFSPRASLRINDIRDKSVLSLFEFGKLIKSFNFTKSDYLEWYSAVEKNFCVREKGSQLLVHKYYFL